MIARKRRSPEGGHSSLTYFLAVALSLTLNFYFLAEELGFGAIQQSVHPIDTFRVKLSRPRRRRFVGTNQSFSACMLVMDDNHRLTEWLAYHYHVLRLRYLVVALDPKSETSPLEIFDQWRGYGMNITVWNETDVFRGAMWRYRKLILNHNRSTYKHRQRQNMFFRNCLMYMKSMRRTWVVMIDSDEYLLFNGPENSTKNYAKVPYPSNKEESSILNFLEESRKASIIMKDSPCLSVPRVLFGAVGSTDEEIEKNVPSGFDPVIFDTLLYRKHIRRVDSFTSKMNGWGKGIIDVSKVHWSDFPSVDEAFQSGTVMNVHQPIPKICPLPFVKDNSTLFRINHYLGSWDAFSYRNDARSDEGRGQELWMGKAERDDETDDNIRPWLLGFVDEHGTIKAKEMLKLTGVFTKKES